jgi:hypothetical protein
MLIVRTLGAKLRHSTPLYFWNYQNDGHDQLLSCMDQGDRKEISCKEGLDDLIVALDCLIKHS